MCTRGRKLSASTTAASVDQETHRVLDRLDEDGEREHRTQAHGHDDGAGANDAPSVEKIAAGAQSLASDLQPFMQP